MKIMLALAILAAASAAHASPVGPGAAPMGREFVAVDDGPGRRLTITRDGPLDDTDDEGGRVRVYADHPVTHREVEARLREAEQARLDGRRAAEEGRRVAAEARREARDARRDAAHAQEDGWRAAEDGRRAAERAREDAARATEEARREVERASEAARDFRAGR